MQRGAVWCKLVDFGARWCDLGQVGAVWCKVVHFGTSWCKVVKQRLTTLRKSRPLFVDSYSQVT